MKALSAHHYCISTKLKFRLRDFSLRLRLDRVLAFKWSSFVKFWFSFYTNRVRLYLACTYHDNISPDQDEIKEYKEKKIFLTLGRLPIFANILQLAELSNIGLLQQFTMSIFGICYHTFYFFLQFFLCKFDLEEKKFRRRINCLIRSS